ncbi:YheC/YheD family protein [Staphylospora marina]|uniref:YheC/YheD family endospore coat-associated protein n=1 Tax=Staphylospora marina TaxID=2490858 RepID=UPI000F5BDE41|nr:YheC/YheD family protein [Staphylospora marina]
MNKPDEGMMIHEQNILLLSALHRHRRTFGFPGMFPVIPADRLKSATPAQPGMSKAERAGSRTTGSRPSGDTANRPVIAILAADGGAPFHGNHRNFVDIIRTGRKMGVTVFVLTPGGIRPDSDTVFGYQLDHRRRNPRWIPVKMPFPDVVYNRVPNRRSERSREVQEAFRIIREKPGVHLFNPGFFDKWTLYNQLRTSPRLSAHLPNTFRLDGFDTLKRMASSHRVIYLKPVEGKAGIGMMRITLGRDGVELIHQGAREKNRMIKPDLAGLWPQIRKLAQQRPYIVQQGIPLARFRNRPFDVRMLLQKDLNGEWGVTGVGIRVAGETSISTHVPMGGRIESTHVVFQEVFGDRADETLDSARNLGLSIARFIEEKQPSPLGEMSIDMGVENNGTLWFFEANAKPMKFDEPEIREKSLRRLIEYSMYLSKAERQREGSE